jgi:hypothetical protein
MVKTTGSTLQMKALNYYAVEMPIDQIGEKYPIVATRLDGERMSVRDKGSIWVVYPCELGPECQIETVYSRSIWQLKALIVMI